MKKLATAAGLTMLCLVAAAWAESVPIRTEAGRITGYVDRQPDGTVMLRCQLPGLADHLSESIRTGASCVYAPKREMKWEL